MNHVYNDEIEWPNGKGYTPCTEQYAKLCEKVEILQLQQNESPELYEEYHRAVSEQSKLIHEGHLGQGVRYTR